MWLWVPIFIYISSPQLTSASPSSEQLYTDQTCSAEEQVGSTLNGINNVNECETECYNRFLSNGDCSFYSYASGDFFCNLFTTCNTVEAAPGMTTYEMSIITSAPTTSPTPNACGCVNGGQCIDDECICTYPYYGDLCELEKDCSCT
jgi:hypothetical protein